ncbi:MAG: hypothetical protein WD226_09820 [Planctomycetota bacterium]
MNIARAGFLCALVGLPLTWSLALARERSTQQESEIAGGATVGTVTPQQLLPLRPGSKRFEIVNGDGKGEVTNLVLDSIEDGRAGWRLELEGYNTLFLEESKDGGLNITRLRVLGDDEDHVVRFEPPIPLLPREILPERDWTQRGRAYLVAPDSEEVEREGVYEHRVAPITQERLPTETGYLEGFSVELEHDIELESMASVHIRIDAGFVPERGLVHRSMRFTVDKPAWFGSTTRRTAVLTDGQGSSGEDD